jgi:glycosyltransferase involved in cell wall biosynthesis
MKVLIVTQYFYPENFRINAICKDLVNRGHKLTVLTGYPNYPQGEFFDGYGPGIVYEKEWEGINIERVKIKERKNGSINLIRNYLSFVRSGNKWAKKCKEDFDIIFVYEISPITVALPAIKFKKRKGTPIVLCVQDLWPESVQYMTNIKSKILLKPLELLTKYIYKNCNLILCSARSFVTKIAERGVSCDKLAYWPQFADNIADVETEKSQLSDEFVVTFTGNIGEAQGLDIILKAAKLIEKEYPQIKWHLVGDGRDKDRLVKLSKQEHLEDTVFFIDRMSERDAFIYLKNSDCAVLTLKRNKLFELTVPAKLQTYMSAGIPIVSAIDGEVKDIINEAKCGNAISSENERELADAIINIYNCSLKERNEMGFLGKQYFDNNYSKKMLMDNLEGFLNEHKKEKINV